jgi:quinol-cytochrome oxidoreductase complex cytochrome b subunit
MKTNKIESLTRLMALINFLQLLLRKLQHKLKLWLPVNLPRFVIIDSCIIIRKETLVLALIFGALGGLVAYAKAVLEHVRYSNTDYYPTPIYSWSFSILTFICIIVQFFSGINIPEFDSDIPVLNATIHRNLDSVIFILMYIHMGFAVSRGYFMEPTLILWYSSSTLYVLLHLTANTGYILHYQSSVISKNLVLVFYSLHIFFAVSFIGVFLCSLMLLKNIEFPNPMKSNNKKKNSHFYFIVRFVILYISSILGIYITIIIFSTITNLPLGAAFKWYVMPFVGITRSMPTVEFAGTTLGSIVGLIAMGLLLFVPLLNTSKIRNVKDRPIFKVCFWFLIIYLIILTWVAISPLTSTSILIGRIASAYYFIFFLFIMPGVGVIENKYFYKNNGK